MARLTKHHLIPKTRHKNKRNKRNFSREEVQERVAWLCRPCHSNLHACFTEKELERDLNTIEALRARAEVTRFTDFIRMKPDGLRVAHRRAKRRR